MDPLLFIPLLLTFFVTFLILPVWIKKARVLGLIWEDMNKYHHPRNVSGSGGLIVLLGFIFGALVYIAAITFYWRSTTNLIELLALLSSLLILGGIGIIDDLLGWKKGGLSMKSRLVIVLFAAIPLMVINAGSSEISLPFFSGINIGILYSLLFIPIGFVGATTTYNFLAGYNGLEASQGIIILSALSLVAYLTGSGWLATMGMIMVVSLIAFWRYNRYPAKVFPGDVLTYSVGGLIAIMAILGNFERVAIIFFVPYILETFLKLRGKLRIQSFGKPNKDGSLDLAQKKFYGLEHIAIFSLKKFFGKATEKTVVYAINAFQLLCILLGFVIYRGSIFI